MADYTRFGQSYLQNVSVNHPPRKGHLFYFLQKRGGAFLCFGPQSILKRELALTTVADTMSKTFCTGAFQSTPTAVLREEVVRSTLNSC